MSQDDDYRRYASEAQYLAEHTNNPADKAAWLRIAQSWLGLLSKPAQTPEQRFDANANAVSTGQPDSEASH